MVKIIDCTLRDGGYYCDWVFDRSLVNKYLTAISLAKIDIVEIGFRFLPQEVLLGKFAYSTDEYLATLSLPDNLNIAVMINANELIRSNIGIEKAIDFLFSVQSKSRVSIVRIATHINDIEQCQIIARKLNTLGYRVFLNLMQSDVVDKASLHSAIKKIKSWSCIEVFYFADSFGNMNENSVCEFIDLIMTEWSGEVGIHAHDNKGYALINSLSAIDCGVNYIDATILGMGRGAGNTKMESLLIEITNKGLGKYNSDAIFSLALREFTELQSRYKWGSSIYYYLSAVHRIHPIYIQEMLDDKRYSVDQILSAISFLKDNTSSSYSLENMINALSSSSGGKHGSWSAKGWAKDKEVLIVGSGPSIGKYIDEIKQYIEINNPIVLCLNINQNIPENLVTAYVACHEARIAIELGLYANLTKPLILPMGRMPSEIYEFLSTINILDYGLKIAKDNIYAYDNGCVLDKNLVLMYALYMLSVSCAKKISLTGIDGYKRNSLKQQEMVSFLNQFVKSNRLLKLCAITPTTYPINQELII